MKIGIIGGIGPESTIEYYKSIIGKYQELKTDGSYPQIVIESIDMKYMLDLVSKKDWERLVGLLMDAINNLTNASAEFAVIASNTPHIVFDKVNELSQIPLLSIVEEVCKKAIELKFKKVGLLGTAFTMQGEFYKTSFINNGIQIAVPKKEEQQYIHQKIFSELELGIKDSKTKKEFISIINRMIVEEEVEGIILGCTELPLILKNGDCNICFLDTVEIHIEAIIREMFKDL